MGEGQSIREVEPNMPLADAVTAIFERRAHHGERHLILETYQKKFEEILEHLPKEKRNTTAIQLQRLSVTIGGSIAEYSSRLSDFVRNIVNWPMVAAVEDFPKDKYYQIELARAQAWGEFAVNTTKTATAERMAYRDHFLPNALVGAGTLGSLGLVGGLAAGALEGGKVGLLGGLQGAAIGAAVGAAVGGAIGGASSLVLRVKDMFLGPPAAYYHLGVWAGSVAPSSGSSGIPLGSA